MISVIFSSMSAMTRSLDEYAPVPINSALSATSLRTSFSSARFSASVAAVTGPRGGFGGRGAGAGAADVSESEDAMLSGTDRSPAVERSVAESSSSDSASFGRAVAAAASLAASSRSYSVADANSSFNPSLSSAL